MTQKFGVSFSAKYAEQLGLEPLECLEALLKDVGVRRLRLMSYWDLHEATQGKYDFTLLDAQLKLAKKYKAEVSLCIGYRQPRYPENHQPTWAEELFHTDATAWRLALFAYITEVVNRYKDNKIIVEWQLENEALNRNFGVNGEFDRVRLRYEKDLVKELDPDRPIVMSTSSTFAIPFRRPRPHRYGFSIYRVQYKNDAYQWSKLPAWYFRLRAHTIHFFTRKHTFIHELQTEPWGPKGTQDLSLKEQFKSMNSEQFRKNVAFAKSLKLYPIDFWGGEWWYWLKVRHKNDTLWKEAKRLYRKK